MENNPEISIEKQKIVITKYQRKEWQRVSIQHLNRHFIRIFTPYRFRFTTKQVLKNLVNNNKNKKNSKQQEVDVHKKFPLALLRIAYLSCYH